MGKTYRNDNKFSNKQKRDFKLNPKFKKQKHSPKHSHKPHEEVVDYESEL